MLVPLHGIASRHDLPLPFSFVVAGAALALILSFAVLLLAWRHPRFVRLGGRALPGLSRVVDHPATRLTAGLLVLTAYAWAGLALLAGQDLLTNPIFGFVFVWVWVGLVPISLLLGGFWRATNPLRTVHAALCRLAGTDPERGLLRLPARLGIWPAALALFGFAWLELVQPDRTTLAVLRVWVLGWLVLGVLGAIVFGRSWISSADPFENYAATIAQLSPWARVPQTHRGSKGVVPLAEDGTLHLVNPLAHLSHWRAPPGAVGVVAALLGSTAFDRFANSSFWISTVQSSAVPTVLWDTLGLLAMIMIVLATFSLAAAWMARYGDRPSAAYPRLMVPSVVPIVIGYAIAHYATLLIVEGQRTAINWSDPLGRGWNVFGSAEMGVNAAIFNHPTVIALIQLIAIVAGHILGIVCAHELAVRLLPGEHALAGQLPMLLVMVGYTCAGLLLLFSP
jgi:hypothetical protein